MITNDLLVKLYGARTTQSINPLISSVGTTATKLLTSNPQRVAFVVTNLSTYIMYLKPDPSVSSNSGIVVDASGGSVSLNFRDDLGLVTSEWWIVSAGASSDLLVIEQVITGSV